MKFLFYTDIHLTGERPRHRIDADYPQVLIGKLREAYQIARDEACEFVSFGGDFFTSHRIFNFDLIADIMDVIDNASVPTYATIGEHDLYGHNPDTLGSSTLAFVLRRCPNLVIVREPLVIESSVPVIVHAKHEWEDMREALLREVDTAQYNILLCHELITNKSYPFEIINTATLTPCPYDLVLSGDLHDGYETHEVNGTWFCNPGSLARRAINEIGRWPQVALIDIAEKGQPPVIELRRLACALPGHDVFGEDVADILAANGEFDGEAFAKGLMEFEADSVDVHELIQKTGSKSGIRHEVLDYLATKRDAPVDA